MEAVARAHGSKGQACHCYQHFNSVDFKSNTELEIDRLLWGAEYELLDQSPEIGAPLQGQSRGLRVIKKPFHYREWLLRSRKWKWYIENVRGKDHGPKCYSASSCLSFLPFEIRIVIEWLGLM